MKVIRYFLLAVLFSPAAYGVELSELAVQEKIQSIFVEVAKDPKQFLPQYTDEPSQKQLLKDSGELVTIAGVGEHESAQIVKKSYERPSQEALNANTNNVNAKIATEELSKSLNQKYKDCQKTVQCSIPEIPQSNDFKVAASNMAVISEASKQVPGNLNEHVPTLFTGRAYKCRKYGFGYLNCCRESGWGQLVSQCSQEEIELIKAREKGTAILVGTKKEGSKLKQKKYDVFCVFESKFGKAIQEQGRHWQLGIPFGLPDNPNCRGISPNELTRLNFEGINFSDAYSSLAQSKSLDQDAITKSIQQSLQNKANANS